ncbi:Fibronectin type III domain [Popillia japonica]|uniref:Fibronectin type III domain n=1 Tax=Popillia japonica TaxID=7064 RepID=A0AAW1IUM6_POPJA
MLIRMNLRFFLQTFLTDLLRFKGTIDAGKEQSRIGFPLKFREIGTSKLRDYLKAALYELKLCDFDVVGIHRNSVKDCLQIVLINIKEEVAFELGLRQRAETQEEDQQIEEQAAAAIPETPVDESITMQEFEKHLLQYDGISTDRRPALSALGQDIPIYIWYESYPTHSGEGYEGRVSRVSADSPYGAASLNLTNIRESDQGWYECKVVFLNRSPNSHKNGTWFHLDVHAPPRFVVTPEEVIYVNLGDAIILNCQAEGTPTPEILWYKDANPVETSATIGIFNDGTELRISNIRHEDIGDYTCIARNGEGQISHTARVIIAGGAVIMVPPTNQTKLEGEKVQFNCEAKALPGNVTVKWFREGAPVKEVAALETRVTIRRDGSLVVNPVSADDSGQYLCEVSNGIGEPQSASAYLNVEYPAKVTFTPTIQYLPFRLAGVVQCYIKANPPLQYVTWTKDKRLLEPYQTKDIVIMNNGSLLFTRVNQNHQGRYTCTPYNAQGTQGSSGQMEVLVRKPPTFTIEPEGMYQRKVGETVEMHCDAQEAEGTQKPSIQWQRRDGTMLQKNRVRVNGGNITIDSLRRSDFGFYQCVASNEVATIVTTTQLVVEGTQPHAPYNLTATATEFAVTLSWLPGYSGGPDYKQDYTIWYREAGVSEWSTIPVTPSGSTQVTINRLAPGTTYEFEVAGKNALGEGMMSKIITVRTLDVGLPAKNQATSTPSLSPPEDSAEETYTVRAFIGLCDLTVCFFEKWQLDWTSAVIIIKITNQKL